MNPARRRLLGFLALALTLPAAPARAGGTYFALQPVVLEIWDSNGFFHQVTLNLTAVFPGPFTLNKSISLKIQQALQTLPYDVLVKPESTKLIKSTALRIIREQPRASNVEDVLIEKLLFH